MEMPRPTDQHRKLEYFSGTWEGEETLYPSPWTPKEVKAAGRFSMRMLGGFFLVSDYEQEREGQITFRGHGVYGWDPNQEKYTMHWFDSMGFDPGAAVLGTWEGNKLCFQQQSKMCHSRYQQLYLQPSELQGR